MKKSFFILLLFQSSFILGETKPNSHAPISVMGDHIHKKNEFMFSYKKMIMNMGGNYFSNNWNYNNNNLINIQDIYEIGYNYYSQNMIMKMDMLGMMYGFSDKITVMLMLNFIHNQMEMNKLIDIRANSDNGHSHSEMNMDHSTKGIGDPAIIFLISLLNKQKFKIHTNIGLFLPFGDITTSHEMGLEMHDHEHELTGNDYRVMRNAYGMQLGSGTVDPKISLIAVKYHNNLSYGSQIGGLIRLFENKSGYSNSSKYYINSWISKNINSSISISTIISYNFSTSISGKDDSIISMTSPETDVKNSGNQILMTGIALNYLFPSSLLNGLRFALEYQSPNLWYNNGIKIKLDNQITLGFQYTIH